MSQTEAKRLRPEQGVAPPHDLDAEAYVLSACLVTGTLYDVVTGLGLTADMFYAERHRCIWRAVETIHERGDPVDIGTVMLRLRETGDAERIGGGPYLAQLVDETPSVLDAHVEAYARTVRDKYRARSMIAVLRQHAAEAYGPIDDVQRYCDEVEAHVAEVARQFEGRRGLVHITAPAQETYERIVEAHRTGKTPGVAFGLKSLDRKTRGMGDGDLIVVAGRPGMGKTAFVLGTATHTARPKTFVDELPLGDGEPVTLPAGAVAVFSLEMSAMQLALRAICADQKLDSQRIGNGEIRGDEWARVADGAANISGLPIWIDDTPGVTVAEIRSRARKLKADLDRDAERDDTNPRLRLVVIDYLQLAGSPSNRRDNREQEISANTRASKALAKELGCPVMLLSQLNRGVETRSDKRPQLSDLRESGAIEQDADQVLFIYRDEYYHPDSADRGVAEIIVAKQRNGPAGRVRVRFMGEYTRFDNLAEQDDFDDFDDFADTEGL